LEINFSNLLDFQVMGQVVTKLHLLFPLKLL